MDSFREGKLWQGHKGCLLTGGGLYALIDGEYITPRSRLEVPENPLEIKNIEAKVHTRHIRIVDKKLQLQDSLGRFKTVKPTVKGEIYIINFGHFNGQMSIQGIYRELLKAQEKQMAEAIKELD